MLFVGQAGQDLGDLFDGFLHGLGDHRFEEGIEVGADGQFHAGVARGHLFELDPELQGDGRLSGLELDGFVGLAVDDAELDLPDGAHFEATMVVGEGEGFDAVLGDAVAHALQVGEVGKHGENAGVVVGNGADGAGEFCHYVCTKEE